MRRLLALALFLPLFATAGPAAADSQNIFNDDPPLATPKPGPRGLTPIELAQQRVRAYLHSIPGMKEDVVVVPATGSVPWPGAPLEKDQHAEIWTVVPREGNGVGAPLMMFAVRTDTGDVFALFMRDLSKEPTFR